MLVSINRFLSFVRLTTLIWTYGNESRNQIVSILLVQEFQKISSYRRSQNKKKACLGDKKILNY